MADPGPETSRMTFVGVVLLILGLGLCVLYRLTADGERHSYAAGAVTPYYVTVTAGHSYDIAIHNGVAAEAGLGLDPAALSCAQSSAGGSSRQLTITAETAGTKATNQIAGFVAPTSGRVHISCTNLPSVFVDDSDDASVDFAGLWLLLGTISLAVGLMLTLSVLRSQNSRATARDS